MERHEEEQHRTRPLLGPLALLGLGLVAAAALYWIQPLARQRGGSAVFADTSALSLTYLRIELRNSPDNTLLRLQLASKLAEIGERREAREVLGPLLSRLDLPHGQQARMLVARMAFEELMATEQSASSQLMAKRRFARAVEHAMVSGNDAVLKELARLSLKADAPDLRARILGKLVKDHLATMGTGEVSAEAAKALALKLKAADDAYLAVGRPYESSRLYQATAEVLLGRAPTVARYHAFAAISRMRESGDVESAHRLSHRFATLIEDKGLSALEQQLAGELGPELALSTAMSRSRRDPKNRALRREVVKWASFAGRPELVMEELMQICFAGCTAEEQAQLRALTTKESTVSDAIRTLEAEVARSGLTEDRLSALVAAYEVTGRPTKALEWIDRARARDPESPALMRLEMALFKRMGRQGEVQKILVGLSNRGALNAEERDELVDGLLAQGRMEDAMRMVVSGPINGGPTRLRSLLELAIEADDMAAARRLAVRLTDDPEADPEDHGRYASLLYELGEWERSGQALFAAWERFGDLSLLDRAVSIYVADGSPQQLLSALERARAHSPEAVERYTPTRLRIEARHRLASYAAGRKEYRVAMAQLSLAQQDLVTLWRRGELGAADRELLLQNRRSALSMALEHDDAETVAQVYPEISDRLSVRERVYVLRRLDRKDEALAEALYALRSDSELSDEDRKALAWDVGAIAPRRRRSIYVSGKVVELAAVRSVGATAAVGMGFDDVQVLVGAEAKRVSAQGRLRGQIDDQTVVSPHVTLDFPDAPLSPRVEAGFDLRDGLSARPTLALSGRLSEPGKASLVGEVSVNEQATDTAAMRMLGTRHSVRMSMTAALGESFYVSASGAGHAYYSRLDNAHLGTGITADVGLGVRGQLPVLGADWNARLTGRSMPRFERSNQEPVPGLFPDSQHFVGVGAGLFRGQLGEAQLWGRDVNFELDAAAGLLWPSGDIGYAATAGIGVPIATSDQLMVRAQVDNTLANNVGQTALTVLMNYSFSLNR